MLLRIDTFGPDALLVRYASKGDAAAFSRGQALLTHVDSHPPAGLIEATLGFTTMLLEFETGQCPDRALLEVMLEGVVREAPAEVGPGRSLELPVVYDGPDLKRVAEIAGLSVGQVIELHSSTEYRVRLLGFSPGFAYLDGLDQRLHTPKLATPRPQVPAGSVAIGGEHTAVYPAATPGGWNLIGRTDTPLLDVARAVVGSREAFGLRLGDAVRFVPVDRFHS